MRVATVPIALWLLALGACSNSAQPAKLSLPLDRLTASGVSQWSLDPSPNHCYWEANTLSAHFRSGQDAHGRHLEFEFTLGPGQPAGRGTYSLGFDANRNFADAVLVTPYGQHGLWMSHSGTVRVDRLTGTLAEGVIDCDLRVVPDAYPGGSAAGSSLTVQGTWACQVVRIGAGSFSIKPVRSLPARQLELGLGT